MEEQTSRELLDEYFSGLQHEHCSWDHPGRCDGDCDCHVEDVQKAWQDIKDKIDAVST